MNINHLRRGTITAAMILSFGAGMTFVALEHRTATAQIKESNLAGLVSNRNEILAIHEARIAEMKEFVRHTENQLDIGIGSRFDHLLAKMSLVAAEVDFADAKADQKATDAKLREQLSVQEEFLEVAKRSFMVGAGRPWDVTRAIDCVHYTKLRIALRKLEEELNAASRRN